MKRNRFVCLLLACLMLAASCGSDGGNAETTAPATGENPPETEADPALQSSLPALDYGGAEIPIKVNHYSGYLGDELLAAEETGDVVDDALYHRTRAVEERLNVRLVMIPTEFDWSMREESWHNNVRASILAADSAFEILHGDGYLSTSFAAEGLMLDLSDYNMIDLDKKWWNETYMETTLVDDKYYFVTGDISLNLIKSMFCFFFNTELAGDYGFTDDFYRLVDEGKWTLDKAAEVTADCYQDLNGNTKRDRDDRYGLVLYANNQLTGFLEPCGVDVVSRQGDDFIYDFGNAHNCDVVEKLCRIVWENDGIYYDTEGGESETVVNSVFRDGNVMMTGGWLTHTDTYRSLPFRYGVLPYPKWDETDDYRTTVLTTYTIFGIPVDCKDPVRASAVLEAMAEEGCKTVTPAYFETALKVKYASDDDTVRMFDLIRDNIRFDFGYCYAAWFDGITDKFKANIGHNNTDWASLAASLKTQTETKLENLMKAFRENAG